MADYTAARVGDAIVITMPLSVIVESIKINLAEFGADRMDVIDIDLLAAEILEGINGSNAIESMVLCEAGGAMENGSFAIRKHVDA